MLKPAKIPGHDNTITVMPSFVQILSCVILLAALLHGGCPSRTREYFIAAVEMDWNYAPTGFNNVKGMPLKDDR